MHAKYLVIDKCCHRQAVKAISECFPEFDVVASLAFIIKSINPIDTGTFMIASKEEEVLRVFNFVGKH